jgi:hypothetical protein
MNLLIANRVLDINSTIRFASSHSTPSNIGPRTFAEIQTRLDMEGNKLPEHILDFAESHRQCARQISLRLA